MVLQHQTITDLLFVDILQAFDIWMQIQVSDE